MATGDDFEERELHPVLSATLVAAEEWFTTADGRLAPQVEPGVLEARVSASQLPRAIALVQEVIGQSERRGMAVSAVDRGRQHRPGIAIGRDDVVTPLRIEELRDRVTLSDDELEEYLRKSLGWFLREEELRQRGWVPRASGRLRLHLVARHDPQPGSVWGWRSSFSDQEGKSLEDKLGLVVDELEARSASGWSPAQPRR
jgi:hypothetical protein